MRVRVRLVLAWYDLWIGAYWDRKERTLYLLPFPMIGVALVFARDDEVFVYYTPEGGA